MTKGELVSLVKNVVKRVDKTNAVHEKVIEHVLARVLNNVIYDVLRQDLSLADIYTTTEENVAVSDGIASLSDISVVPLPRVGEGVIEVRATGEDDMMFYPMTIQQASAASFMEMADYVTDVGYTVRNNEIKFTNIPDTVTAVDIDVVRSFEDYDYDETFFIPAGQDEVVVRKVLEILGVIQPVNLLNNNSDEFSSSQGNSTGGA